MLRGIDVSTYQGNINWSAVKADGIDFAIVKATQGHAVNSNSYLFTDRQFANNVTGAHDVGLKVGVYPDLIVLHCIALSLIRLA